MINHFNAVLNNPPDFLAPWPSVYKVFSHVPQPWIHITTSFSPALSTKCDTCMSSGPSLLLRVASKYKPTVVFLVMSYFTEVVLHSLLQFMTLPPTLVRRSRPSSVVSLLALISLPNISDFSSFCFLRIYLYLFSHSLPILEVILFTSDLSPSLWFHQWYLLPCSRWHIHSK